MRVLVVGLGSMGKRRIRLLQNNPNVDCIIGVDSRQDRRDEVFGTYGVQAYDRLQEGFAKVNGDRAVAFVCTSPLAHASIITDCLNANMDVFSEINLVSEGYERNIRLAKEKGLLLFLSSTGLYRKEINYIIKRVSESESPLTYLYHEGQYLPDWHPWDNLSEFFLSDARTSGCRELMAIEFPWLIQAFGHVIHFDVLKSENTSIGLGHPDCYSMLLRHSSGAVGLLTLDVVSRRAIRHFEVFGEDMQIEWNGATDGLFDYDVGAKTNVQVNLYNQVDHQDGYMELIVENSYQSEIESFFNCLLCGDEPIYDFADDLQVLNLIDAIESRTH